ncbi:TPR repeat-containing isoform B [Chlorella sorokiniana]|uniref:TPR repeat-containing isoform B n=1 Tax=Chlorella sorokiniana TaxID=3076 RepID=A0A2P6TFS8_CHLSO|nr:TPR repeat-containing isoform B [Chlorella sorokiniana]|eukprot:PRW32971.1 TPR repeat-containing isoform B [Chlorella sorokiniana]
MQMVGFSPELAYGLAACRYRAGDLSGAAAALADVVQAGVQLHPELGIGTQTEGMEARSVGNSAKLKSTALVEAFNLRAAIELAMGSPSGAAAALSDMPPRAEHELDSVTLHNQALVSLALAAAGTGGTGSSSSGSSGIAQSGAEAFDKLVHLLEHPPFPPELAGNLLSLCCRPDSVPGGGGPGPAERAAVAGRLLAEHGPAVEAAVPGELLPLYEACVARASSAEEAAARLDALAGTHIEGLRRRVKAVQDARWAGDAAGAAAGLQAYEEALDAYVPVLMSLVQLHWEAGAYGRAQEVLQQSAEFCSDHPAWRLNLAHALVAQEGGRLGEAAELYESILRHFAGGAAAPSAATANAPGGSPAMAAPDASDSSGGSLLDVPPSAVANLCVCHVISSQNEAAEELLRRLEDETTAAEAGAAGAAGAAAVPPHLSLANLAIGTLYCSKGNFEFGISRVVHALEPLGGCLDAPRWHAVLLCLLAMLDQVAKNMLVLKDALVADLLGAVDGGMGCGRAAARPAGATHPRRAPAMSVTVKRKRVVIPTYAPCAADRHPQFIETRVYQGSSGKVYPLPFIDRISEEARDQEWDAVWLENEHVRVQLLPQLGGRIHVLQDKHNGYDAIYRQHVIKPALVGLAGPWISGGVEFNWPQHHRPSTFMPCDVSIERESDGAVTVWCSEHEPMQRMKGMHGVRLRPGSALVELRVRLYNRTPLTQTFLWWANAGVHVHDQYQSFFPPDVHYVADHAKRAMSEFPLCRGRYYGVDYGSATDGSNDLSWYKNIPVPTSYMACNSEHDFFGGYDHGKQAGLVHVANHHISPGKKQWTWGDHPFGHAWDRNLTDSDGPYIELMAGVYTDNQPDFSWLEPGETKTFSQYWYPIQAIGPAQHANLHGALSLSVQGGEGAVGVAVTAEHPQAVIILERRGSAAGAGADGVPSEVLLRETAALGPAAPLVKRVALPPGCAAHKLTLRVLSAAAEAGGRCLLELSPAPPAAEGEQQVPDPATEPPAPQDVQSVDELYLTGLHLEQYRHPTRDPCLYWREGLARDPGDARCNTALGKWHLRRGECAEAERHLRSAVARLTARNPNPADGEAYYLLGLALKWQGGRDKEAYAALYKATWNYAWRAPAYYALAQMDAAHGDWEAAAQHCRAALATNADFLQARNLCAAVLRRAGKAAEADELVLGSRALDPLDWWSAHLAASGSGSGAAEDGTAAAGGGGGNRAGGDEDGSAATGLGCGTQTALDVALDYADAGLYSEALDVLEPHVASPQPGTAPLLHHYQAYFRHRLGQEKKVCEALAAGAAAPSDYVFPARLQELAILQFAVDQSPDDARARFYLGCWLYDRRRYAEAIALWRGAVELDGDGLPSAWRCLGIAAFNIEQDAAAAAAAYDRAFALAPTDSRLLYERDQLAKRCGTSPAQRLAALEAHPDLVRHRDALAAEACALYCQEGRPEEARRLLEGRRWQPWEGGEGEALAQHVRCHLALARTALAAGQAEEAVQLCQAAMESPANLGEAKHLLANDSDVRYALGCALAAAGRQEEADEQWRAAAEFEGDFQSMAVCPFSEQTLFSALALRKLGREEDAHALLERLLEHAQVLAESQARVDYFATSLPAMLLFHDDLQERQETKALFLEAQARLPRAAAWWGLLDGLVSVLCGAAVGAWVDSQPRLHAASRMYLLQNSCVAASAAAALGLLWSSVRSGPLFWAGLVVTMAAGSASTLGALGSALSVEREWTKALCGSDSAALAHLNAAMKRIDLTCLIASPILVGLVMQHAGEQSMGVVAATLVLLGWNLPTAAAALALALLYFTVLSFGTLMTAYLKSLGLPEAELAVYRGLGALSGILATVTFPPLHRWLGLVATGSLSIWLQLACLLAGVAPALAAALGAAVGAAPRTYALVWGLVLSRFGLWSFDLAANQLIQETVEHSALGAVSGVQGSLQSFCQMLAYAAGVLVPATESFVWLMAGSCCVVGAAAALYTAFALRARCGQNMHVVLQPV